MIEETQGAIKGKAKASSRAATRSRMEIKSLLQNDGFYINIHVLLNW